jgi:hypothetical protein
MSSKPSSWIFRILIQCRYCHAEIDGTPVNSPYGTATTDSRPQGVRRSTCKPVETSGAVALKFCRKEPGARSRDLARSMPFHLPGRSRMDLARVSPCPLNCPQFCEMRIFRPASLSVGQATNGRISGWRPTTLPGGFGRWKGIGLATFRVPCLAIRETELNE